LDSADPTLVITTPIDRHLSPAINELRVSEERYRTLVEIATDYAYVWRVNPNGTLEPEWLSSSYATVTGYSTQEIGKKGWQMLVHPEDKQVARAHARRLLAGTEDVVDVRIVTKENGVRWIRDHGTSLLDGQTGRVVRIYGAGTDITEQKNAEEKLRATQESERRLREQLMALHEVGNRLSKAESFDGLCRQAVELGRECLGLDRMGIWFRAGEALVIQGSFGVDETGNVRDERKSVLTMDRTSPMAQVLAKKVPSLVIEDTRIHDDKLNVVGRGYHALASLWDGQDVIGCISADNLISHRPITDSQQELLRQFAANLGHLCTRKRAEEALARSQSQLQALNQQLKRAMTETHHRVKNNLQIIAAMVDLRLMDGGEVIPSEEVKRLGTHIRTLATVHDVLTHQAKQDEHAQYISSKQVLEKLLPLVQQTAAGRQILFRVDDAHLSARQGTSLALVVNELVSNALKYGRTDVNVQLLVEDHTARLIVEDDGDGFDEGFDAAAEAETGLDLVESLSKWDLGGHTCYENRTEGGARVSVTFPLPASSQIEQ
jgi:PAS domain S-box-containing protein